MFGKGKKTEGRSMGSPTKKSARETVSGLRQRLRDLESEQRQLNSARWAQETAAQGEAIDTAAQALLDDVAADIPDLADIDARLKKIAGEIRVVGTALFKANGELATEKRQAASAMVKKLRPQHKRAVQKIAHALTLLEAANREEEQLRAQIPGGGNTLPPASFPGIGGRYAQCSPMYFWFKFAAERDLLVDETTWADAAD